MPGLGNLSGKTAVFTDAELAPMFEPRIADLRAALAATPVHQGGTVKPEVFA
jgi:hypothetical protein